ncbi:MAG: hypothetical protein ACC682_08680 [Gemmatimonadota bacterium]
MALQALTAATCFALSYSLAGCAVHPPPDVSPSPEVLMDTADRQPAPIASGVLVMAHGGSETWNAAVEAAVAPLGEEIPTAIAFGMASPVTLQNAVDELESAGVARIAVIRLFISGESFLHRTKFLFDKRTDARPHGRTAHGSDAELHPIRTASQIEIDPQGLVDGFETGVILRDRALALSRDPTSEAVLILAHGNGDEAANNRLLENTEAAADVIRADGFRDVRVETLREDWAAARDNAESRIRGWVTENVAEGRRVIVIPFRLSGFGPFKDVLEGLEYEADGQGLIPHEAIGAWLRRRTEAVFCTNGWRQEAVSCPDRPMRATRRTSSTSF